MEFVFPSRLANNRASTLADAVGGDNGTFLTDVPEIGLHSLPIDVKLCRFSVGHYHDKLFQHFNIPFPEVLLNAVEKRKAEFLAARVLAKRFLREHGAQGFQLVSDRYRCPLWPEHLVGSISHSHGLAVCTVGSSTKLLGLGIDIERVFQLQLYRQIKAQLFESEEIGWLENSGLDLTVAATIVFSAKESIFKALYPHVRKYFDFSAARTINIDPAKQIVEFRLTTSLSETIDVNTKMIAYYVISGDCIVTQVPYW